MIAKIQNATKEVCRYMIVGSQPDVVRKLHAFTVGLDRYEFYAFYALMTALSSPSCGDHLMVSGKLVNLKKIVRRLRITIMSPRFSVDYAPGYTCGEAKEEMDRLSTIYASLHRTEERQCVAKVMGALEIIAECRPVMDSATEKAREAL